MRILLTALLISAVTSTGFTQKASPVADTEKLSRAYMQAYLEHDFETLEGMMADDMWYHDPIAEATWDRYYKREGKAAVLELFRGVFRDLERFTMKYDTVWFSQEFGFFEGTLSFTNDGELYDAPGKVISIEMPFVAIVHVKDGKIKSHQGFAHYETYLEQLGKQLGSE